MRLIAVLLGITLVAAVPLLPGIPPYWITILDRIGLAALVAIGLVLLTGVGGMTSFGQAAFAGFGAYTTAVLTMQYGFSAWLTLPFALVVAAAAAVPLGLVTVRLSGHFLPLGTIAWGISLYYLFGQLELLGRYTGLAPVPPFHLGSKPLYDDRAIYYVIWACVLLAAQIGRAHV